MYSKSRIKKAIYCKSFHFPKVNMSISLCIFNIKIWFVSPCFVCIPNRCKNSVVNVLSRVSFQFLAFVDHVNGALKPTLTLPRSRLYVLLQIMKENLLVYYRFDCEINRQKHEIKEANQHLFTFELVDDVTFSEVDKKRFL